MPSPTRTPRVRSKKTAPSAEPRRSRPGNQHARDRARSWRVRRVQVPTLTPSADTDEAVLAEASPPIPPSSDDSSALTARITSKRASNLVYNTSFLGGSVKPRLASAIVALCALAAVALVLLSPALWLNTTSTACLIAASKTWARTVLQNETFYVESKVDTPPIPLSAYTWARCASMPSHRADTADTGYKSATPNTWLPQEITARLNAPPVINLLAAGIDTRLH